MVRVSLILALMVAPGTLAGQSPSAAPPRVHLTFVAETPADSSAAAEYRRIWAKEEQRVVATLERISGRRFIRKDWADTAITVLVLEASANSGSRGRAMRMRSSYSSETKLATLVHELGHRLQDGLFAADEEEHEYLFLWLYDVWVALEGLAWADRQVAIERPRAQRYVDAWDKALALSPEARAARWKAFVAERSR
jgi:hypothetical protein